jgi:hypothetical protein
MLHSRSSSASLAPFVTGSLLLVLFLPASLSSQPAPKGLQVLSATLDPEKHEIAVDLRNTSTSKTVVAYSLTIKSLDSAQHPVGSREVEFDFVGPEPNSGSRNFIPPGGTGVATVSVAPDVQLARVSVFALVFEDLSFEGDSGWIFHNRRLRAEAARQGFEAARGFSDIARRKPEGHGPAMGGGLESTGRGALQRTLGSHSERRRSQGGMVG